MDGYGIYSKLAVREKKPESIYCSGVHKAVRFWWFWWFWVAVQVCLGQ